VGSLEAYASATGIAITAKELLNNSTEESLLRRYKPEEIDSKAVYDCAMQGDAIAKEVYRFTGQILGEALANFVMFSSPEAIVLFGGVIKAGDLIMDPTKEHMEKNLLPIFQNKVRLIFSELQEADAAISVPVPWCGKCGNNITRAWAFEKVNDSGTLLVLLFFARK
jgi:glucokinase